MKQWKEKKVLALAAISSSANTDYWLAAEMNYLTDIVMTGTGFDLYMAPHIV